MSENPKHLKKHLTVYEINGGNYHDYLNRLEKKKGAEVAEEAESSLKKTPTSDSLAVPPTPTVQEIPDET